MSLSDYDYSLPKELIAQEPLKDRSKSRLMVLFKDKIEHRRFFEVVEYLNKGDTLVINDSKVIPAKLKGRKPTGGKIEVLLLKEIEKNAWECLIKGKNLREGTKLIFKDIEGKIIKRDRKFVVEFNVEDMRAYLEKHGEMPLPPYIKKELKEKNRYQTIYARKEGSVAAPTAGLHFSKELLNEIRKKGINIAPITLHVSIGTFAPVRSQDITKHKMEAEYFEISKESAEIINKTKGKVIAVGTTVVKALESSSRNGEVVPLHGWSDLFIYPPYEFKSPIKALITNFHLPKSTLLMLVCAFAGRERIFKAYRQAIAEKYRFYSFGDAMLIFK
ncbi:MAG: tRNA preQ1(34) S-adenosylmethionine ribosyltransferase-isomerase QueA [Candidatus Hydrothermarchaeota archaeon]|nr:MAG: tRNA preQ1(34) S-adenosylmethionine ribosyltransferase-isomerase QueA [Candidatus Hydrothermarchaeota archaeon]